MIKKFFQLLKAENVSYILISGQATVIYGAAPFSEDIDIWVKPTIEDWNRFLTIIRKLKAKVYKLTPPLRMDLIQKGHGYHFQFSTTSCSVWFLDVMGKVPRVGDFQTAYENVCYQETDWGSLPVMGIRDLVELKKTRRLSDYAIISNLVKIEYERLMPRLSLDDWKWVLKNSFEVEDLLYYLNRSSRARKIAEILPRRCLKYLLKSLDEKNREEVYFRKASRQILLEIDTYRQQDIIYWKPIISELKLLQKKRKLLPENSLPPLNFTLS